MNRIGGKVVHVEGKKIEVVERKIKVLYYYFFFKKHTTYCIISNIFQ